MCGGLAFEALIIDDGFPVGEFDEVGALSGGRDDCLFVRELLEDVVAFDGIVALGCDVDVPVTC